jgi:HAD superfamily hydrolase (TIGR01490 family)
MGLTLASAETVDAAVRTPAYLVFSDVDETLITCKSMFDFLRFHLVRRHGGAGETHYARIADELRAAAAAGTPREEVNRRYYRHYAGTRLADLTEDGRAWFDARTADGGFFLESTRAALLSHRAAGAELVLVSGSFTPCLTPVAEAVGATRLLATTPLTVDGRLTGEVVTPMIGEAKRQAVRQVLASHPWIDPGDCVAFGDHPSDLPMLTAVGQPYVVGGDPRMLAALRRTGRAGTGPSGCSVACWSMGEGVGDAAVCPRECADPVCAD